MAAQSGPLFVGVCAATVRPMRIDVRLRCAGVDRDRDQERTCLHDLVAVLAVDDAWPAPNVEPVIRTDARAPVSLTVMSISTCPRASFPPKTNRALSVRDSSRSRNVLRDGQAAGAL